MPRKHHAQGVVANKPGVSFRLAANGQSLGLCHNPWRRNGQSPGNSLYSKAVGIIRPTAFGCLSERQSLIWGKVAKMRKISPAVLGCHEVELYLCHTCSGRIFESGVRKLSRILFVEKIILPAGVYSKTDRVFHSIIGPGPPIWLPGIRGLWSFR